MPRYVEILLKIRKKFERECAKQGVELVYVKPHYTSHLGNLIATENGRLSRDVAATVVIGLRSVQGGNAYLNRLCMRHINEGQHKVRLNAKGKFGQHVLITGGPVGLIDTTGSIYKTQERAGASISEAIKHISTQFYFSKWLKTVPTIWTYGSVNVCGKRLVKLGCRSPSMSKDSGAGKVSRSSNAHAKTVELNSYLEKQFSKQERAIRNVYENKKSKS